jgi:DNA-binding transcriptional LysR family regulator
LDWAETGQALREGRIDIGFIRTPPKGPFADHAGLIITRLQLDPRVAAVRRDHALASRRQLSVQQLNPYPIVANRGVSVAARAWWIVNPRPDGSVPTQLRSASSVGELLEAVAMTGDIAITTKSSAEIHLRPDIKYIPLVDIDPAVISLAWDSASSNPSVRRFVEIARKMTEI